MTINIEAYQFICEVCDGNNILDADAEINELIECIDCGTEFEITGIHPIQVTEVDCDTEDWGQ